MNRDYPFGDGAPRAVITRTPSTMRATERDFSVGVMNVTESEARFIRDFIHNGLRSAMEEFNRVKTRGNVPLGSMSKEERAAFYENVERENAAFQRSRPAANGPEYDERMRRLFGERINAAQQTRDRVVGADITGLTKPKTATTEEVEPQQGNRFSGLDLDR